VRGWFALVQDVTDRTLAEEALRRSEEQLRTVTDNVPAFIAYADREKRYRFVNRVVEEWYGLPASQILGSTVEEIVGKVEYAKIKPGIEAVMLGESVRLEMARDFPDGSRRNIEINYVPDIDEAGQVRGCFALIHDVTERRTAEEALRHTMRSGELALVLDVAVPDRCGSGQIL
jgi:PAS domain S-box-containing protein